MDRLEYKYQVPCAQMDALRRRLLPFLDLDPHAGAQGANDYTVRSIYFDTPALNFYHEKEAGIRNRIKLRIRGYNQREPESQVFLEVKRKQDMTISKNRAPLRYADLDALLKSGDVERYALEAGERLEDARRFLFHLNRRSLQPILLVIYEREAYFHKFDTSVRITLDKRLRSLPYPGLGNLFSTARIQPAMADFFILEIKFYDRFPHWFRGILEEFKLDRMALSKYAICLESQNIHWGSSTFSVLAASKGLRVPN